jgi:hypothetical protein
MRREEELAAARAVRCAGLLLVPVLRVAASAAATPHGGGTCVASAEAELVGVWLARAPGAHAWLPGREAPPGGATWLDWLRAHPALLRDVAARLAAADVP